MQEQPIPASEAVLSGKYPNITYTTEELINSRVNYWDATSTGSYEEQQNKENQQYRDIVLKRAEQELDEFIGMEGVKKHVRHLKARIKADKKSDEFGLKTQTESRHLRFIGPPGTGKTTIAGILAKFYFGLGLIDLPEVIETGRSDFVAGFQGQSLEKTRATFLRAKGGVLFIDDFYAIYNSGGNGDDFGKEVLNEIVTLLENERHTTIVIVAGYEADIDEIFAANDGLQSRIPNSIKFESYDYEQLWDIAVKIAALNDKKVPLAAHDKFIEAIRGLDIVTPAGKNLLDIAGNARFVRSVIKKAIDLWSERIEDEIDAIIVEDFTSLSEEDIIKAVEEAKDNLLKRNTLY